MIIISRAKILFLSGYPVSICLSYVIPIKGTSDLQKLL